MYEVTGPLVNGPEIYKNKKVINILSKLNFQKQKKRFLVLNLNLNNFDVGFINNEKQPSKNFKSNNFCSNFLSQVSYFVEEVTLFSDNFNALCK